MSNADAITASTIASRKQSLDFFLSEVAAAPYAYDFFWLLRRVECLTPASPRFGQAVRPSQEPLRLGQEAELQFAPAAVASLDLSRPVPRLGVRLFGLLGPQGPMPLHVTEYVRERERQFDDPTLLRFLDMFHHRMLTLFYRAWTQSQPAVQHDRPAEDRFAVWLGALSGQHHAPPADSALPWNALLHQAGLLASRSRHPEGLIKLLRRHFQVPIRIVEHVGHWMTVLPQDRSCLGRPASSTAQLGRTAVAGSKVWDRQFKFRIVLGPMTLAQYVGFLPGTAHWRELSHWVRLYVGLDLLWDVELCLARAHVPEARLGRGSLVQLNRTAWLGRRERDRNRRDRSDLRLHTAALPKQTPATDDGGTHV